jgi:hypothetical protein
MKLDATWTFVIAAPLGATNPIVRGGVEWPFRGDP